jgi:hypothetical protein
VPPVAPLVAGWQRRLGGQAGPLGPVSAGSGESPSGAAVQVELYVGGLWVDITSLVMVRDGGGNVAVTRGKPNEGAQTDPASCRFQLNNRNGAFSPRNPMSPYFGVLGRNTPLRVSVQSGLNKAYRFWGEVASWPQKWDSTGTDVWVDVEAAGILRRLRQGESPVGSTMYTALASLAQQGTVVAYWPCEDASGATVLASAIGGPPMGVQGTPTLANSTAFVCSTALPTMGAGAFTGAVPSYITSSAGDFDAAVRFLLSLPSGGSTNGQVVCTASTSGTIRSWEVYYSSASGGFLGIRGYNSTGTLVVDSGPGAGPVDGVLYQATMDFAQVGPDVNYDFNLQQVGQVNFGGVSGTVSANTLGSITSVSMTPGRGLTGAVIGHISVQTGGTLFSRTQELNAFAGETAAARILRLCALAGVGYEQIGNASDTVAMGVQTNSTIAALIDEAVTADGGILYEQTGALGLGYRTRVSLENQSAALALSYSAFNLSEVPAPTDDDQTTRNDVTVSRPGGSSARATLTSGALSVLPPPAGVGPYPDTPTVNVQSDTTLADQAGWRLHLGTVDEARYPKISVNLAHPSFTASTTLGIQALGLRPGDRLTISGMPTFLPPDAVSQLILGYSETIDQFQHRISWNCAPESPYRIAVTDDPVFGRVDTDGSALAADLTPAGTTVSIAVTAGPTWTVDPTDYPFDLTIGGERVTAYAAGQTLGTADGTFETGVTGWTATSATFVQSADHAYRGAYSGLLTVTGSPSQAYVRPDSTHDAPVTVGQSYRCSMWVYSPIGYSSVVAAIDWNDSGHGYLSTSTGTAQAISAGVWTLLTCTATAPASAAFADYGPTISSSPPTGTALYVDDVVLVAASSYTSLPQQMTVVRSVNGVVKPQVTGTDVRLQQPSIVAL